MKRQGRGLVGYLSRDEPVAALQGGTVVAGAVPPESLVEQWQRVKKAVESRSPVKIVSPIVESPPEARMAVEAARRRADLSAAFAPHRWHIAFVDLSKPILSYQRVVVVEDAVERVSKADQKDVSSLFEVCLPEAQAVQMEGGFDPVQNAFTTTSLNPNLRVAGFAAVDAGVRSIPCVVIEAQKFEETGAARPGFFGYELLYGERPPLVTDFLSEAFSVEVPVPAFRKVIRIKAEEFAIPV